MRHYHKSVKMIFLSVILGLICFGLGAVDEPIGVVVNIDTNCIQLIDPVSMSITDHLLKGKLGSYWGGLLDVVISSDGKTAVVSNFGDSNIHFIDISGGFNAVPVLKGKGYTNIFAEDMVITPDDKYVLVTDGGFNSTIVVVDMASTNWVHVKNLKGMLAQSVDITPDGKLVLVADNWGGALHSLDFDGETGTLTYRQSRNLLPYWPTNTAISPDGRTVLVLTGEHRQLPVFYIDSMGDLCSKGNVMLPTPGVQSGLFSPDGRKAYVMGNADNNAGTYVHELDILGPGQVFLGRSKKMQSPRGGGYFYGVDTLGIDPSGQYLFVSNPTSSGGKAHVTVLDVNTLESVSTLPTNGICAGITFGTIAHPEE